MTADGRIELWDLHISPLDPVVRYFPEPDEDELAMDDTAAANKEKEDKVCVSTYILLLSLFEQLLGNHLKHTCIDL